MTSPGTDIFRYRTFTKLESGMQCENGGRFWRSGGWGVVRVVPSASSTIPSVRAVAYAWLSKCI